MTTNNSNNSVEMRQPAWCIYYRDRWNHNSVTPKRHYVHAESRTAAWDLAKQELTNALGNPAAFNMLNIIKIERR